MPDTILFTPTWFLNFPSIDGIINTFVRYEVKITSPDLKKDILQVFVVEETDQGDEFAIIQGAKVHQEVTCFYQNLAGEHKFPPQVLDTIAGLAGYPVNLRVAFEGVCTLADIIHVITNSIRAVTSGDTFPDGTYTLIKDGDYWKKVIDGVTLRASCSGGLYLLTIMTESQTLFENGHVSGDPMNVEAPNTSPGSGSVIITP